MSLFCAAVIFLALGEGSVIEYDCGYWTGRTTGDPPDSRGRWVSIPTKLTLVGITSPKLTKHLRFGTCLVFCREKGQLNGDSELLNVMDLKKVTVVKFEERKKPLTLIEVEDIEVRIKP